MFGISYQKYEALKNEFAEYKQYYNLDSEKAELRKAVALLEQKVAHLEEYQEDRIDSEVAEKKGEMEQEYYHCMHVHLEERADEANTRFTELTERALNTVVEAVKEIGKALHEPKVQVLPTVGNVISAK